MKKLLTLMLAIALVLAISSPVCAVDIPSGKISLSAEPVDYTYAKTGYAQPVSKAYVANERFAVLVSIEIPDWLDTGGLGIEVTPKNCTIDNIDPLTLATGDYLITGTTLAATATVKVSIKDNAANEANNINDIWRALYGDRTVSATATLGVATTQTETTEVSIPKTGSREDIAWAGLCLLLAAALMWRRRHA